MARRKLSIELDPIVAAVGRGEGGAYDDAIFDATASLLVEFGLSRWSVDDVADRADIGRSTVYRRFPSRDDLVHGVLARELRRVLITMEAATSGLERMEDRVVEAVAVGLAAAERSVVGELLRNDPASILPVLTTGAAPLLALARSIMAPALVAQGDIEDPERAALLAETIARLGLSYLLTPETVMPVDDPEGLRRAVGKLLKPLLGA